MDIGIDIIVLVLFFIIIIDIWLVCKLLINKIKLDLDAQNALEIFNGFLARLNQGFNLDSNKISIKSLLGYIMQFINIRQSISISKEKINNISTYVYVPFIENYYVRRLSSKWKYVRIHASSHLAYIPSEKTIKALERAISVEKDFIVKLYFAFALSATNKKDSIPFLIETLKDAPLVYREKANVLISQFGKTFFEYIPSLWENDSSEIQELIVDFASTYLEKDLKNYLLKIVDLYADNTLNNQLLIKTLKVLEDLYYTELDNEKYLQHDNVLVRIAAIKALSKITTIENINKLISFCGNSETDKYIEFSVSIILKTNNRFIFYLMDLFNQTSDDYIKNRLAQILSNRIEYLILKLTSKDKKLVRDVLKKIMLLGKNSSMIGFLNRNTDIEIENEIIDVLKEAISEDDNISFEYCTYLNDRIIKKCNLLRCEKFVDKKEEKRPTKNIQILYSLLVLLVLMFPIIYVIRHWNNLFSRQLIEHLSTYVIDFNYYLIYYSTFINMIYLILLIMSFFGISSQSKYWKLKSLDFMFKRKILPSISIIAPAFNEETTIIESTNSLLNLRYPDYELIIVNDGSKDKTLNTLINYFDLERIDFITDIKINTMSIRGVYAHKSLPKLLVVDKENGGKADSLNAGINISTKEYFCGIDADSLLETDALLKLASLTIDSVVETAALGGNILPANGCSIKKGFIEEIKIPKNKYARLQTIEYIRAFMAGRIGWTKLNCLLIISGAFGLFKKDRVIEIGGYLTSSGKYGKDTVGEDMELVVRLTRYLQEKKERVKINYGFNANCWTEVPESLEILKRQRDRWHRGLIDILTFHKKILFNPKYKQVGLIAFPYFFIFEMIGPLIEIQGYLMVIIAAILGLLNLKIALLLFISTIGMGTMISLASLLLAEKDINYFRIKEVLILVGYSIIENFGFRQMISLWRVSGYISSLKKPKGWGKMERKGFATSSEK